MRSRWHLPGGARTEPRAVPPHGSARRAPRAPVPKPPLPRLAGGFPGQTLLPARTRTSSVSPQGGGNTEHEKRVWVLPLLPSGKLGAGETQMVFEIPLRMGWGGRPRAGCAHRKVGKGGAVQLQWVGPHPISRKRPLPPGSASIWKIAAPGRTAPGEARPGEAAPANNCEDDTGGLRWGSPQKPRGFLPTLFTSPSATVVQRCPLL